VATINRKELFNKVWETPELKGILLEACHAKNSDFLEKLLKKEFKPVYTKKVAHL
jgi:hypothetical protein